jgi:hypothetical protein
MSDDPDLDTIRDRLAKALGWQAYNRLVESVSDVRQRGRLRFWQERFLERASLTGVAVSTAEEFIKVFGGASPVPVPAEPWTREVFLSRIEAFPHGGFPFDETPPEWMAAAWEIDTVRQELSGEMARTVGKTGELAYTDEYLRYLSRSLPVSRQVELFLSIRDGGNELREAEFRPGFERAFPACVPHLPPPLTRRQLADLLGVTEDEYERRYLCPDPSPSDSDDGGPDAEDDIPF